MCSSVHIHVLYCNRHVARVHLGVCSTLNPVSDRLRTTKMQPAVQVGTLMAQAFEAVLLEMIRESSLEESLRLELWLCGTHCLQSAGETACWFTCDMLISCSSIFSRRSCRRRAVNGVAAHGLMLLLVMPHFQEEGPMTQRDGNRLNLNRVIGSSYAKAWS